MVSAKFRGKRTDNGEWVYGYYFKTPLTNESTNSKSEDGWYFLTGRERHCISKNSCVYEVVAETIGRYTDKKDVNRKEIYEGDIVLSGMTSNDEWIPSKAIIRWNNEYAMFVQELVDDLGEQMMDVPTEVIGNIFENLELLTRK